MTLLTKQELLNKAYALLEDALVDEGRDWHNNARSKTEVAWALIGLADRMSGTAIHQIRSDRGIQDE